MYYADLRLSRFRQGAPGMMGEKFRDIPFASSKVIENVCGSLSRVLVKQY